MQIDPDARPNDPAVLQQMLRTVLPWNWAHPARVELATAA